MPGTDKASKAVARARRKSYEVFLRVSGASSLDELILPLLGEKKGEETEDAGCWAWLVNVGENGGDEEGKRALVHESFKDEVVWVPLLGLVRPYSSYCIN